MPLHDIEEVTLVMCECCYELRIEDDTKEFGGMSFCWECIADLRYLERWIL